MHRYSPQFLLAEIAERQELLLNSTVAIVGMGALGTHCSELLARAGVENLILIDNDAVEESNLQRQTLFTEEDLNKNKVEVAKDKLKKINSGVKIIAHKTLLTEENVELFENSDLVLDCTDNLDARFVINKYCKNSNKTWIYSSAVKTSGYVMAILPEGPCLECFLQQANLDSSCTIGVLNTIVSSISSLAVTLAIKILTKQETPKDLYYYNIWKPELRKLVVNKNINCKVCVQKNE